MAILSNKSLFQYPRTPGNRASINDLVTEPSHRISSNKMVFGWEADPEVLRRYVPEPLTPDPSGLLYAIAGDSWVYTDRNATEFISDERVHFAETYFWIPCDFEGERYHYVLYSWGNRDWLLFMGRHAGMPHKLAKVELTRFHAMDPVYFGPHEGVRMSTTVETHGLLLKGYIDLERQILPSELPFEIGDDNCPKWLCHRYFFDVVEDRPLVNDLVVHWGDNIQIGPVWEGTAHLEFFDTENEDVLPFQPIRMVGGWALSWHFNHSVSSPVILHTFS